MDFHSGKIADFVVSPDHNVAITIGSDSRLKVWDFIS